MLNIDIQTVSNVWLCTIYLDILAGKQAGLLIFLIQHRDNNFLSFGVFFVFLLVICYHHHTGNMIELPFRLLSYSIFNDIEYSLIGLLVD